MNNLRSYSRLAGLIGLILVMGACSQIPSPLGAVTPTGSMPLTPSVQPSPTSAPSPTPYGGPSAKLGPVPKGCPPGPTPRPINNAFGPAVGSQPAWAVGFIGPHAMLVWSLAQAEEFHNQYGWSHKLLWVVQDNVKVVVTIYGANLRDGSPLRPDAEQAEATSTPTMLILNSQNPNVSNHVDHLAVFPGSLTISEAGCYYLQAQWPGGSWRIMFAAGVSSS